MPRRQIAHFVVTIEAVALFVLGLFAVGGAREHRFSIIPYICAVPVLALLAKRPWIDAKGVLHTRAYFVPYFRRIDLAQVVIFELVAARSMEWSPRGNFGVRARLGDGRTMQVQESSSMRQNGPLEWLTSLNGLLERARGAPLVPWVSQPRKAALLPLDVIRRDPYESIRTVRQAAVEHFIVKATSVDGGFAALTTLATDGSNIRVGPVRPTVDLAVDDAIAEIDRLTHQIS